MTRTEVLRWLPRPRLKGSPFGLQAFRWRRSLRLSPHHHEDYNVRHACPSRHGVCAPFPIRAGNACAPIDVGFPWRIWHVWSLSEGTSRRTSHARAGCFPASPFRNGAWSHVRNGCISTTCAPCPNTCGYNRNGYSQGHAPRGSGAGASTQDASSG